MPTLIIDGESFEVDGSKNLLEVCIQLGREIPYFCWHPAIGSVGSCRQCAVTQFQDADDQRGRMVMSCMTSVTDGMIISLKDPKTQTFRDQCIESVMANHPHDCPVCEKGGECHLQDMTNLSDHTVRIYDGKKRTHRNQQLGPFINHEMNRCITCYRCVRYYQDYAGGDDLQALGSSSHVYFGRDQDGPLENPFSGNLVEVCPTGVFTDKTYSQHYTRKWDLQTAPSICSHCSVGCNTSPGERYGTLRRVVNRYNGAVNGYFLCDRGRYAYDFVNSEQRVRNVFRKQGDRFEAISDDDGLKLLNHWAGHGSGSSAAIGIGSPRASLEANYALLDLVGKDNFYAGVSHDEQQANHSILNVLSNPPAEIASLQQVKQADAILVLGEDILNTAPLLALSVRQATKNKGKAMAAAARIPEWLAAAVKNIAQEVRSPLFNLTVAETDLDPISQQCYHDIPEVLVNLATAIAYDLDATAPPPAELNDVQSQLVSQIVSALKAAQRPLIIAGSGCQSAALVNAAGNIAQALSNLALNKGSSTEPNIEPNTESSADNRDDSQVMISLVVQDANSLGLTALIEERPSADLDAAIKVCVESKSSELTALVLENDLSRRVEPCIKDSFDQAVNHLIAIDCIENKTTAAAELILPAASVAESEGTFVSNEGRAQRHFSVYPPAEQSLPSWQWLEKASGAKKWQHFDEVTAACAEAFPLLKNITEAAPDASFRLSGRKVARQPHRYSGRGSMHSNLSVDETQRPNDDESALSYSMEGLSQHLPNALQPDRWAPAWNSSESVNQMQSEVGGELKGGDPGVRLFDERKSSGEWWRVDNTQRARSGDDNQSFVPVALYHIFGSDELSVYSPSLAQRIPAPYVALNTVDANALHVTSGEAVSVQLGDTCHVLTVRINDSLVVGSVGLPQLKEFQFGSLQQRASLKKSTETALQSQFPLATKKILIKEILP